MIGSGPGQWLVLAAPQQQVGLVDRLRSFAARVDELVTVVDMTHGRALIRLTGSKSPELLAKECGVDLSDGTCPDGTP